VRFLESLATWLKQFDPGDRAAAYDFIKRRLVYISLPEMQCLVETFLPEVVTPHLRRTVAHQLGIKPYEVWADKNGADAFTRCLRKTLFVGMSDGSRIDSFRRANAGRISTEQVVPMMHVDKDKWLDLGKNPRTIPAISVWLMTHIIFSDYLNPAAEQAYEIAWDFSARTGAIRDEFDACVFLAQRVTMMVEEGQTNRIRMANHAISEYQHHCETLDEPIRRPVPSRS
jgi:hypothetical protein